MSRFLFPRWSNKVPALVAAVAVLGLSSIAGAFWYYGTNKYFEVGYQPVQPVEFSHKIHAGNLGLDCRYCHNTVERSSFAAVPPSGTCMNCHARVKTDSPLLLPLYDAVAQGKPVPWIRVHNLPDYVYFDHSAHLAAGVGCSSCHGRIDQMPRVTQLAPLTMGWCLECHRNPGPNIRAAADLTNMAWQPKENVPEGPVTLASGRVAHPPTHCSGCHR